MSTARSGRDGHTSSKLRKLLCAGGPSPRAAACSARSGVAASDRPWTASCSSRLRRGARTVAPTFRIEERRRRDLGGWETRARRSEGTEAKRSGGAVVTNPTNDGDVRGCRSRIRDESALAERGKLATPDQPTALFSGCVSLRWGMRGRVVGKSTMMTTMLELQCVSLIKSSSTVGRREAEKQRSRDWSASEGGILEYEWCVRALGCGCRGRDCFPRLTTPDYHGHWPHTLQVATQPNFAGN